ncbi:hypothetical protein VTL71DRAFT_3717 [Oculimacula yallundae]|uniref:Uncharacterized protein n=1 Tax=Oculimacula yallundae TaxID=86028 RepID=A0ABR4C3U4_9HELO
MSSYFGNAIANVDEFVREMTDESENSVESSNPQANEFDFSIYEIPDLSAEEMSYLHEVDDIENGSRTVDRGHDASLTSQRGEEESSSVGADDFYGEEEEKKEQDDDEVVLQREFENNADDSSDVEGLDEDELHKELLKAGRRGNRLEKFNLTDAIAKASSEMAALKDDEWASYKSEKEDIIAGLNNDKAKLKSQLKEIRKAGKGVRTHDQLDTASKPWPTRIMDLPQGDSVLIEFQNMMSTANIKYNDLQGHANNLQSSLNNATSIYDQLQSEIDRWKAVVQPISDKVDNNNNLIDELQQEVQRLTDSESHFKTEVNRLDTCLNNSNNELGKLPQVIIDTSVPPTPVANPSLASSQTLLNTTASDLAAANEKIWDLNAGMEQEMKEASKRLGAAQFESMRSAEKVLALEKELMEPRANNSLIIEARKVLTELEKVKEENKKLKRANYNVVQGANKEVKRLREINLRLVHKMNEPQRKIALREAYLHFQSLPEPVVQVVPEIVELLMEGPEEGPEEEPEVEKVEEKEVVVQTEVPGGWSDTVISDATLPSPIASITSMFFYATAAACRKVDTVWSAAFHIKFTARFLWNQWKSAFFWMFVVFLALLHFCGKTLLDPDPEVFIPKAYYQSKLGNMSGELVGSPYGMRIEVVAVTSAASTTSSFPSPTATAVMLGLGMLILLYRHLLQPTPLAQDRQFIEAELALEAAVRANILAEEERKAEEAEAVRRQWQEDSARQPEFFESLHAGWTPSYQRPRKYWGNNL